KAFHGMSDLILYTTEDGRSQIKLRAQEQPVWLTQLEIAELFDATKQNISLHLKNVFDDGELDPAATVKESLTVQVGVGHATTTEQSSVVQLSKEPKKQWRPCHGMVADHFRGVTKMIELEAAATCREFRQVRREGTREVARQTTRGHVSQPAGRSRTEGAGKCVKASE
ncbi:DNA-binding protein, partial [mine drainage metagenome]